MHARSPFTRELSLEAVQRARAASLVERRGTRVPQADSWNSFSRPEADTIAFSSLTVGLRAVCVSNHD